MNGVARTTRTLEIKPLYLRERAEGIRKASALIIRLIPSSRPFARPRKAIVGTGRSIRAHRAVRRKTKNTQRAEAVWSPAKD